MTTHTGDESSNSVHAPDKQRELGRRGSIFQFPSHRPHSSFLCFYLSFFFCCCVTNSSRAERSKVKLLWKRMKSSNRQTSHNRTGSSVGGLERKLFFPLLTRWILWFLHLNLVGGLWSISIFTKHVLAIDELHNNKLRKGDCFLRTVNSKS